VTFDPNNIPPRPPRPPELQEADEKHKDCWRDPTAGFLQTTRTAYIDLPTRRPGPPGKEWNYKTGKRRQRIGLFCARCKAFWPDRYPITIDAEPGEVIDIGPPAALGEATGGHGERLDD
jgi:hypothetical protein